MLDDPRKVAIRETFAAQFEAVEALGAFAREHRPSGPPSADVAGVLIMATYARGSKTFQAAYQLVRDGYGAQAGMLNRSLFEDMNRRPLDSSEPAGSSWAVRAAPAAHAR
jgi:hypothetical protein